MPVDEKKLAEVLCNDFGLSLENLELARSWQRDRGGWLADVLIEMRAVPHESVLAAIRRVNDSETWHEKTGAERRTEERIVVPYRFVANAVIFGQATSVRIRDISNGGICFDHSEPIVLGTRIQLQIVSPGGNELDCVAVVRFSRQHSDEKPGASIGVQFVELSAADALVVSAFVAESKRLIRELEDVQVA